jgi:hypothetical protein
MWQVVFSIPYWLATWLVGFGGYTTLRIVNWDDSDFRLLVLARTLTLTVRYVVCHPLVNRLDDWLLHFIIIHLIWYIVFATFELHGAYTCWRWLILQLFAGLVAVALLGLYTSSLYSTHTMFNWLLTGPLVVYLLVVAILGVRNRRHFHQWHPWLWLCVSVGAVRWILFTHLSIIPTELAQTMLHTSSVTVIVGSWYYLTTVDPSTCHPCKFATLSSTNRGLMDRHSMDDNPSPTSQVK